MGKGDFSLLGFLRPYAVSFGISQKWVISGRGGGVSEALFSIKRGFFSVFDAYLGMGVSAFLALKRNETLTGG